MEEQFPKLAEQIDFSPFYNSLLERINAYAKGQKNIQDEGKKVLTYIYTVTLGRLLNLRENSERILIIDIQAYLKMIEDNIKTLKDLQVINNKVEVINNYKENFKSGIDKKIDEAQSLIEKQINPEMEKIRIDDQINSLIEERLTCRRSPKRIGMN
ncbi:unnamed protein product [Larinioides sclopetarius]|uniref:Uncharacterized protein n=1 Tax=Larinioides sclopetarius TaxID=280406 RepID=A0AAV1ZGV6_9ARAC